MDAALDYAKPRFLTECDVRVLPEPGKFLLLAPLKFYSARMGRELTVPSQYITDFASIPKMFRGIIDVNGKHRRAAVLHDYGCDYGHLWGLSQRQVDKVFKEAMDSEDVRWTQRRVMYRAVRTYQASKAAITDGWRAFKGLFR